MAPQVKAVCELAGIKDMRAKVYGSHNPHTTIRAIFEARPASTPCPGAAALAGCARVLQRKLVSS